GLRLRAILADPTLRLQRPQRAGSQDEDRLRVLLAVEAEGNLSPYGRRFAHFVKGLSGVEGRGSPPGSASDILLQPLRNHNTPEDALNGDSPPFCLVLDPAELMAVILDLEGRQLPHSEGAGSFAFLSLRCFANQGLRSSLTSSDRETLGSRPFASRSRDRKSTRLNSSHVAISYAVFCLKKKKKSAQIVCTSGITSRV